MSSATLIIIAVLEVMRIVRHRRADSDLEQHKTEFLALAAHYFLTPLSVIRGNVSMLVEPDSTDFSETERRTYYQIIQAHTNQLLRLVQNITLVAAIDAKELTVSLQPVNIINEIDRCVTEVYAEAAQKHLTVVFNRPKQLNAEQVRLDSEKFRLALVNVLSNAVKFTPEKGSVEITLSESAAGFSIKVTDSGIGIPRSELAQLYTRFHRGTSYLNMEYQGIGLGLYLARYLIEANGGSILVESKQNAGTAVRIDILR